MSRTEPIRIIYSEEEKIFKAVGGVLNLGYMGVYKTDNIHICTAYAKITISNAFYDWHNF